MSDDTDLLDEDLTDEIEVEDEAEDEDLSEGERDRPDRDSKDEDREDEEASEQRQSRPVSRATKAVLAAKEIARAAKEEAAEARRQLEEVTRQQQQRATQVDPAVERDRLALMSSEERAEYRQQQAEVRHQQQIYHLQFQMYENNDRASFRALAATDKLAAKMEDKVEQRLLQLRDEKRRAGESNWNIDRKTLFTFLVGEEALARGKAAGDKERKGGANNIRRQTSRPGNAHSNVSAPRQGAKTLEERLADVRI